MKDENNSFTKICMQFMPKDAFQFNFPSIVKFLSLFNNLQNSSQNEGACVRYIEINLNLNTHFTLKYKLN